MKSCIVSPGGSKPGRCADRLISRLPGVALISACLIALAGCSIGSQRIRSTRYPFDFAIDSVVEGRNAIIFLLDGCRADLLYSMAREGELPSIKKYLIDRGVSVSNAVTSVPPITNAAISTITCGAYPGHIDVVGNRWFDRDALIRINLVSYRNYYMVNEFLDRKTIYQILSDQPTVTVSTPCIRGSTFNVHLHYNLVGMSNYLFKSWRNVDRVIIREFSDVVEFADREGVFPRVTFFHLAGTDYTSHKHGPLSEETRESLRNIDRNLGELFRGLERNGVLERMCVMLLADHGQDQIGRHNYFNWARYICGALRLRTVSRYGESDVYITRALGLRPVTSFDEINKKPRAEREKYYSRFSVVEANNGRNLFLYFRHNPGDVWTASEKMAPWSERPSWDELRHYATPRGAVDLVQELSRADGAGAVIGRPAAGEVAIFTREGESRIRTAKGGGGKMRYAYEVLAGDDPLGYSRSGRASKLMDGDFHPGREWLEATADLEMPGIVPQLPSLFESRFTGDLLIVAAPGWDFEKGHRGTHGGFLREEMRIPLLVAGTGIRRGEIDTAMTVDIVPTILDYLGFGERESGLKLDGRSFLAKISE